MTKYYNPKEIETNYISPNIKILYNNDSYYIIAQNDIKKDTIILKEIPKYNLFGNKKDDELIEMLYILLQNKNDPIILNLYPRTTNIFILNKINNPYNINLVKLINNTKNNKLKSFILSFDKSIIYQHYYKYIYNAFNMYSVPTILSYGAMINHSCKPNIYFYENNNAMYFKTLYDIKKGDELKISYLRNKTNETSKEYLLNHYNFICNDC